MPTFPASLPVPAINTLQESPPVNAMRSQMDKGPDKVRRRTTANVRPLSFNLMLTSAEVATLDTFFVTTTFSGTDKFDYIHPRTGDTVEARFTEPPIYGEQEGVLFNTGLSLEILP